MTTLKVNVIRKPTIKVKVLPNFPSSVTVSSPILLSRVGGNYAFSFDQSALGGALIVNADNITLGSQTGTGAMVRATSPILVTPNLGTPSAVVLTNATGTAAGLTAGNVTTNANLTGDVTSVGNATTLATVNANVGTFGSATQSITATFNAKGLLTAAANVTITPAIGSITGLGAGVATFLATPSSANLATAVTGETGSGALVFSAAPTFSGTVTSGGPLVVNSTIAGGTTTLTSTSAGALVVASNGAVGSAALAVDASAASQVAGITIRGATTAGIVSIAVNDSGSSNTPLVINAKGSGTIGIGSVSTGAVTITPATTLSNALTYGGVTFANTVTGSGSVVGATSPTLTNPVVGTQTIADNSTKAASTAYVDRVSIICQPQGRLTLTTGVFITSADVTAAATVYYTASQCPTSDGTNIIPNVSAQLSVVLDTTNHLAGRNFDVFKINDAGTMRIGTGPSWNSGAVAGSDTARGTGAGSTDLALLGNTGIMVNANSMTVRYSSSGTVSVAASQAVYLGTIRTTANGQTEDSLAKRFVWNAYNQALRMMRIIDATASWTILAAVTVVKQANNNTANQLDFVIGLGGTQVQAELQVVSSGSTATYRNFNMGIGLDTITVLGVTSILSSNNATFAISVQKYRGYPGLGRHYLAWLEQGPGADTMTLYGSPYSQMTGEIWG